MDELPGLYLHVPFCRTKCPYCAFCSGTDAAGAGAWADAVAREAQVRAGRFAAFDTLYVGGGTPTALPDDVLARAVAAMRAAFPLSPGAECTIEANPGDLDAARAARLRALGFDRLSLGVQALDDPALAFLGRRHDAAGAVAAVRAAREGGFGNVGIDLMFGLPGQDVAAWIDTIDRAAALGPDHLSCYQLTIEEGTPLAGAVAAGRVAGLPDEARSADLFLAGAERLEALGYEQYEVSNFARPGRRSRHNGKYWRRVPYVGIGPSAHSFDGTRRWWNLSDPAAWVDAVQRRGHGEEDGEVLGAGEARLESLALGLRTTDGVAWSVIGPGRERTVARLVAEGLLREAGERVVPTRQGLLVADALARDL